MKITIITGLYEPHMRGGAERAVVTLAQELKKTHVVSIVTVTPWRNVRSFFLQTTIENSITIYRFYPCNFFSFISIHRMPLILRFFWHCMDMLNIHTYFTVCSVLKKEKPDIVWTHNLKGLGYTVPAAVRSCGIRHIHTPHDIQLLEPSGLLFHEENVEKRPFLIKIYQSCTRFLFGSPHLVVFPSRFLQQAFKRAGFFSQSKKIVLPNPSNKMSLSILPEKMESIPVFFYAGQLEPHKGILVFLLAIESLRGVNAKFLFAGRGSLQHRIEEAVLHDHRIEYRGFLDQASLHNLLLHTVHFTVLPTLCYENAPMSVVESLSVGVPVIVSDVGGAAEYIEDGKNGYRIRAGNDTDFMNAIQRACFLDGYNDLRKNALRSIENIPSPKQYIKEIFFSCIE